MGNAVKQLLEFGPFRVHPEQRVLLCNQEPVPLSPKAFELLLILVERNGQVVLKDDLMKLLWPDTFVEESNLSQHVFQLRKALGERAPGSSYILTVPGRGYRFAQTVRVLPYEEPGVAESLRFQLTAPGNSPSSRTSDVPGAFHRIHGIPAAYLLLVGLVVFGVSLLAVNMGNLRNRFSKQSTSARATPFHIASLAVLPFENLSGDPSKDYFADGFTDELITDIAEQAPIRVVSRSSVMRYKGSRKPLPEIARELNVDAVVEGSVSLSDEQVRITAQLIQAAVDQHLWAHSYERARRDLFSIQREVAATISALIGSKADTASSLTVRSTDSFSGVGASTYELALDCRALRWTSTEEGVRRAIQCYEHLLALDPNSAVAYAGLADCYMAVDPSKAGEPAVKAISLNASLPEAHLAIANVKLFQEYDLAGAEAEFERTLTLNPNYAEAHIGRAWALVAAGRATEAISEASAARELDPFSIPIATFSAGVLFMARQYDKAIEAARAALELDPDRHRAHYWAGYAYEQKGMYKEAIAEYKKVLPEDDHGIFLAGLGRALVLAGDSKRAAEVKFKIEHRSGKDFMWPYDAALFCAAIGDKNRTFEWLEKERAKHDGWLVLLQVDPRLFALRSDPRLLDLAHRVGLAK